MTPLRLEQARLIESPVGLRLQGAVTGHPRFPDGRVIATAPLTSWSAPRILSAAQFSTVGGRSYLIGSWDPAWVLDCFLQDRTLARLCAHLEQLC